MKGIYWAVSLCKALNFQVEKLRLREGQLEEESGAGQLACLVRWCLWVFFTQHTLITYNSDCGDTGEPLEALALLRRQAPHKCA